MLINLYVTHHFEGQNGRNSLRVLENKKNRLEIYLTYSVQDRQNTFVIDK